MVWIKRMVYIPSILRARYVLLSFLFIGCFVGPLPNGGLNPSTVQKIFAINLKLDLLDDSIELVRSIELPYKDPLYKQGISATIDSTDVSIIIYKYITTPGSYNNGYTSPITFTAMIDCQGEKLKPIEITSKDNIEWEIEQPFKDVKNCVILVTVTREGSYIQPDGSNGTLIYALPPIQVK